MNKKLSELSGIMRRLREENGCPWDREQTHDSLKSYLIEEAYEVLEAIESGEDHALKEELGDLLFQVVFHSQIANEGGRFSLEDVIENVSEKMIRRHPHVFGDEKADNSGEVLNRWEDIKGKEKNRESMLEGIPRSLPSLIRAKRLQERAARVGFDWPNAEKVWEKVEEEWRELQEARASNDKENIEEEMGDLMIALVNLGRFLDIDGDTALGKANEKFIRRFTAIEREFKEKKIDIHKASLDEMEEIWVREREKEKS
ncbi:MAG: nucleoside triphosphate pyrophosphohydrolase [Nitrospinota bacterium]|nr:nucleoside triphosphate pyrophosphohydrolase [Nitrospinota bacterium]